MNLPNIMLKGTLTTSLALLTLIGSFSPILSTNKNAAHAQFGAIAAFEVNPAVVQGIVGPSLGISPKNIADALLWSAAKLTVASITRSTVNWINSGFNGSPAFVSDLNENLSYLGDAVAEDFFNQLNQTAVNTTGFNIVSPFQDQIAQKLRQEYYLATSNTLGLSRYDLNGYSTDPKAFINGDFSKGGFDAFFAASQNPANNPFGAYELASNALWGQINAAAQQRKAELDWGNGFLPWRGNCSTAAGPVSLSKSEQCRTSPVRTPGSVIESQLEQNLGTGVRQLELADSINEVVGALMGQLVNQVLGPGGLLGASQYSSGGGSSYVNQATDASQYDSVNTSIANGVVQNIQNDRTSATAYRDEWQKVLDAANAAQARCGAEPEIGTAITKATAGVQKGNAALAQIGTLETRVQNAIQSTSGNKSALIIDAVSGYQSYLRSSAIPTPDEQAEAAFQSSTTAEDATESETSLYTKMTELATECRT